MKIGELAQLTHCNAETIRYYEKIGLVPLPQRTDNNYRVYSTAHIERLRFIRNCRSLDMTHDEIRSLLQYMEQPTANCTPVNNLVAEHIRHVDLRLAELTHLRAQLLELHHMCQHGADVKQCGILEGISTLETNEPLTPSSHLG